MSEINPIPARSPSSESQQRAPDDGALVQEFGGDPGSPRWRLDSASAVEVVRWLRRRRLALPPGQARSDARIVARIVHLLRDADIPKGQTLREALQHDLAGELVAIHSLRRMIPYLASDDPSTRPLIEGLLDAEEKHADDLSDLIAELRS